MPGSWAAKPGSLRVWTGVELRQGHSPKPRWACQPPPPAWQLLRPPETTSRPLGASLWLPAGSQPEEAWRQALPKQYWGRGAWPGPCPDKGDHSPAQPCLLEPQVPYEGCSEGAEAWPDPLPMSTGATSAQCGVLLVCEAHGQGGTFRDLTGGERPRSEVRG